MVWRTHEVDSTRELERLLAQRPASAAPWRLQGLDLRPYGEALSGIDVAGMVVLGGTVGPALEHDLRTRGALVFPTVPGLPFDPYRVALYTAEDLYSGLGPSDEAGYEGTPDALVYAWSLEHTRDVAATLAGALHDHAIDNALADLASGHDVVGVMGAHAVTRGTSDYVDAARLGLALAELGCAVATGGGPGAMEAANLGARAAGNGERALQRALATLAVVPDFRPSVTAWARAALQALDELSARHVTIGVPTWFYGHEPPNVFATHIAKYFRNALREDTLLRLCDKGIVFLPGAAGTVQEIFQDACENYYADPVDRAPMVLVGRHYWTEQMPAWPLLQALGVRAGMDGVLHLVDTVEEALQVLGVNS
jgi:predicted Rossmann-fold nucleotide-binding protein